MLFHSAGFAKPIRFRLPSDPITLDWNLAHTSNETQILMNMMAGLVESGEDLSVKPALAEKWEISDDGLTYRFFLRRDAKWSDGKPVTAQQFADSWLRLLDPKLKSPYASFLFPIQGAEEFARGKKTKVSIEASDATTLKVTLKRRAPYFLHIPSFWVTFPIRAENTKLLAQKNPDVAQLKVTGPYRPVRWLRGKEFILEPNPHFPLPRRHGQKPDDRVEITFESNEERARAAFRAGQTDLLLQASTADMLRLSKGARLAQVPYLSTTYLGIHTQLSPLQNLALRQAIARIIHHEKSTFPALMQGGQIAAGSWVPPSLLGHHPPMQKNNLIYEARQLVVQAGYPNGQGLPGLKLCSELFDRHPFLSEAIAKALERHLGMKIEIVSHATAAQFNDALKSNTCHLFVNHWGGDFPDPTNFYEVFRMEGPNNYSRWNNSEYDDLLKKGLAAAEEKSRLEIYTRLDAMLTEKEAVIVPLFYGRNALLVSDPVKKLVLTPLNYLYLKDTVLDENPTPAP